MEQVTITRLGHLGDGIAQGPVFVAQTLPGEVVEGEIDGERMIAPKIVTPSPDRVRPPCSHYKMCGGCALQHASDDMVAGWKAEVVKTALTAQGLDAPITGVSTSPARSRVAATLTGRRTKKGALVGFHARASDTVVDITDCHLLTPTLMGMVPALRELTQLAGSRSAEVQYAMTQSAIGVDLSVAGAKPLDDDLWPQLAAFADRHNLARLTWNGELIVTRNPPAQTFGGVPVVPPAGAFLQATDAGQAALIDGVDRALAGAKRVADLFAGCGTFTFPLARRADVTAVESDVPALSALDAAWRKATDLHQIRAEKRDLFRRPLMPDELRHFDGVVIDPPRAGCEAQAIELAASTVPVIAAVSCNPVTFARDAAILVKCGYRLAWVQVVDQFRWSPHVEVVAQFIRD